jgi:Protein of unknown function (DUF1592)/Protein of unknown function (DUF1588)/Protein of unknown function (DUF1587)/Protein of unknown function (DUF1585)/Protein of unknown function (DUF1595)/Ca-dependent carbohydrate-binding module xylan-binding
MALRPALFLLGAATVASFFASGSPTAVGGLATAPLEDKTFDTKIQPFLQKYCVECHKGEKPKGGVTLNAYQSESHARKDRKNWEMVRHVVAISEMPPPKSKGPQPTKEEREFVLNWIENSLTRVDCKPDTVKDPGRVTIRRLNRAEYNNTIRDLCGVDFKPAEDFPADDVGYGFDNIGDVLSFQPILLEKYLAAADKILATAINIPEVPKSEKQGFGAQNILVIPRSAKSPDPANKIVFKSEGSGYLEKFNFTAEGDYTIRFRGWATNIGEEYPKVVIRVEGKDVKAFSVEAESGKAKTYEATGHFTAGEKRVSVAFTNPFEDKADKKFREFGLERIEIEGPANPVPVPEAESVKLLLTARPKAASEARAAAEKVLTNFARRAYRRPVKPEETERLLKLFDIATKQGEKFEQAIKLPMKAVLVSPHFLYRIEEDPKNPNDVRTISDFEFATRLSYFLWSSMPDEELFALAAKNELRKPAILEAQLKRMLKDPKAKALSENFAGQWLELRKLKSLSPDKGYYPGWDDNLKAAMVREAEAYFEYIVQNDRSILEFLDSDYTFVNERLAKHYGITGVSGSTFQRVSLNDGRRGGIITMASTLTVTSNPTRTSPVKRGKWILDNILGTPPPPPAPDVPELPATSQLKGTLRQQMEQHRENPRCAVCHAKLDPLGFGLENFDGIGAWRTQDNKKDIDSSGVLPGGEKFAGPAELRKVLLTKADMFRHCFAEKLLTFGMGRGLEYYDKCALDDIVTAAKANKDTFSALVLAIVKSDPFQKRKGKRSE